MDADKPLVG